MSAAVGQEYKCVIIEKKGGDFTPSTRKLEALKDGQVLIKVLACGVCGGDHAIKDGLMPQASYPRIPGHEVVGTITQVGPHTKRWKVGDRVGRAWHGGHCFVCRPCLKGEFVHCTSAQESTITGLSTDGGMAEYMIASQESLIAVPKELADDQVAPLLCAGVTVYNSLRNVHATAGSWVAVQGLGGLGHLAVQFAAKMGYRVIALSTSADKESFAKELGASAYIDTSKGDAVKQVQTLTNGNGVAAIIATSSSGKSQASCVEMLGIKGTLLSLGAGPEPLSVYAGQLIHNDRAIQGWSSGGPVDVEETLEFAAAFGVKVYTEKFPLEKAGEAYEKMNANKIRFRAVLIPGSK